MNPQVKDIEGERFGRLLVVKYAGVKGKRRLALWWVTCDCGEKLKVTGFSLRQGHTQSCGCLRRDLLSELGKKNAKAPGVSVRNQILHVYKQSAKRRNREWGLTDAEFDALILGDCHYCGVPPIRERQGWSTSLIYNGIDRVKNYKGYVSDNVVSCCYICNRMKGMFSLDEFVTQAKRIAARY